MTTERVKHAGLPLSYRNLVFKTQILSTRKKKTILSYKLQYIQEFRPPRKITSKHTQKYDNFACCQVIFLCYYGNKVGSRFASIARLITVNTITRIKHRRLRDMELIFLCSLNSKSACSLSSFVRYPFEHSKINSTYLPGHVISSSYSPPTPSSREIYNNCCWLSIHYDKCEWNNFYLFVINIEWNRKL